MLIFTPFNSHFLFLLHGLYIQREIKNKFNISINDDFGLFYRKDLLEDFKNYKKWGELQNHSEKALLCNIIMSLLFKKIKMEV